MKDREIMSDRDRERDRDRDRMKDRDRERDRDRDRERERDRDRDRDRDRMKDRDYDVEEFYAIHDKLSKSQNSSEVLNYSILFYSIEKKGILRGTSQRM
jgi:hypothetical protein